LGQNHFFLGTSFAKFGQMVQSSFCAPFETRASVLALNVVLILMCRTKDFWILSLDSLQALHIGVKSQFS
jgi:hypothetical protein